MRAQKLSKLLLQDRFWLPLRRSAHLTDRTFFIAVKKNLDPHVDPQRDASEEDAPDDDGIDQLTKLFPSRKASVLVLLPALTPLVLDRAHDRQRAGDAGGV